MSSIILMGFQLSLAAGAFLGVARLVDWYNKDIVWKEKKVNVENRNAKRGVNHNDNNSKLSFRK